MLHIKNGKVIILISLIIIIVNLITLPKKKYSYDSRVESQIAKGIIVLEKDETLEETVNKNSFPLEYNFVIKNFDENNNINEVDFDYKIRIENSADNFPIKYKLIDSDEAKELQLNSNETSILTLKKLEKEIRHFKLYVEWNDLDLELADNIEIKLKVEAVQHKEGIIDEEKV